MTIETPFLNVEKYAGDGVTKTFGFGFRTFEAVDVVVVATDTNGIESTLDAETDYFVTFNSSGVGGTLTLSKAPVAGTVLVITRNIPIKQEVDLVNQGEFYAETIEGAFDRLTAIAQDMYEQLSRTLVVPISQSETPEEVFDRIFTVASLANQYAEDAKKTYEEVLKTQAEIEDLRNTAVIEVTNEGTKQVGIVNVAGSTQVTNVTNEGNKQVERLQNIADFEESGSGVRCVEVDWVVQTAVTEGTTITIPQNFIYVVGRNQLRMAVNGLVLLKDENFAEVGETDYESSQIVMKMPLAVGDEVQAWTVPLGRGGTDDLIERIKVLEDSISDLSARVVYRGEE